MLSTRANFAVLSLLSAAVWVQPAHGQLTDDCDGNGVNDLTDIALSASLDCNDNLVLDQCELPGPADVEIVFIVDTSGSMQLRMPAVCNAIAGVLAQLAASQLTVEAAALLEESLEFIPDYDSLQVRRETLLTLAKLRRAN